MAQSQASVTLEEEDLNDTDEAIIRLLNDGRCSPRFLASELDLQQPYVSQRLKRLVEHGHVTRVDRGLYELASSPLSEAQKRSTYRERALAHYGDVCEVCDETENIVVHHRDGDRTNNDLPNLIPLCEACHGKVHGRSEEVSELVRALGKEPVAEGRTTIEITEELADELYSRKSRGETYSEVIRRLLDNETDGSQPKKQEAAARTEQAGGNDSEIVVPESVPQRIPEGDARRAIAAAVELVTSNGGVQRSEIAERISEHHSLGYDNFGRKGAWWRKVIKPGLEANGCSYTNGVGWSK